MKLFNLKIFGLIIVIAIALLLPVGLSDYWQYVLTVALFYVIMAVSWNLLGGYTGQFSLAHHSFGMIGAYTSTLLMASSMGSLISSVTASGLAPGNRVTVVMAGKSMSGKSSWLI